MKTTIEVEIKGFPVPTYVSRVTGQGRASGDTVPLRDLSVETLGQLCDEFRHNVFLMAGKAKTGKDTLEVVA